jgi:hypothetical protein
VDGGEDAAQQGGGPQLSRLRRALRREMPQIGDPRLQRFEDTLCHRVSAACQQHIVEGAERFDIGWAVLRARRGLGPRDGRTQRGNLLICRACGEQPRHGRLQCRTDLVDLPRLVGRDRGDREHPAPAADDQAFGLQRLQRRAHGRTADVETVLHLAFDEPCSGRKAKREYGLAQASRAAPSQCVVSRARHLPIACAEWWRDRPGTSGGEGA